MSKTDKKGLRFRLHEIIFEADTRAGRIFDAALAVLILGSVLAVILESVDSINLEFGDVLRKLEWFFTLLFTAEYILRLAVVKNPRRYAFSFLGIVDFLSAMPTYLSLFVPGAQAFLVIRTLRLLRLFRIFKMARYVREAGVLMIALRASKPKITVFLFSVVAIVIIAGSMMHIIEGEVNAGFSNIPSGIYWAVVTVTTVGFGDITPITGLGRFIASLLMILGYGIIAVPTGIVTAEIAKASRKDEVSNQACLACGRSSHDNDATFCKFCGGKIRV